jgi:thiazolylpeptide-type bacteriocin precursor
VSTEPVLGWRGGAAVSNMGRAVARLRKRTQKGLVMNTDFIQAEDVDKAFASFEVAELEMLEVSQGVALPEMGASSGSIGTSSSSSSTCSAC